MIGSDQEDALAMDGSFVVPETVMDTTLPLLSASSPYPWLPPSKIDSPLGRPPMSFPAINISTVPDYVLVDKGERTG